ncbi:hypothetical protein Sme01_32760 [Sphaerisporangium melleum]|uniref:Deoxyribonuclease NucA/NucB domain-containing protein n=1 Tax=Sphaerisporangium melleum TaxID=321316 RepID=A0A917RIZ8_9ACTN|nr:NucA/NucB deoxyribonuclease domain-containing protein [Sphaerisporangium melleum]GGL09912.1 hypothetical protein GCM10007964_60130 [Sphaerisporangium melleum]GII70800.1 hypothetical protein Sme01_32760 [Sphaerisporangium melleum]
MSPQSTPSYPPTRNPLGNEQNKNIPGNWLAKSDPLTRGKPGVINTENRLHFSRIEMHMDVGTPQEKHLLIPPERPRHAFSINYCKYYMPQKYPAPFRADGLPPGGPNSCDEYPFAATLEGAKAAKVHFSVRAVNAAHNSLQGRMLETFFTDFRAGEGNRFWVLTED